VGEGDEDKGRGVGEVVVIRTVPGYGVCPEV